VAHGLQLATRADPVTHSLCEQVIGQAIPQTLETSPTHVLSHELLQQYGSTAQICVTHGSHPLWRATPVEHLL
jgi:hypothetical protein